MTRTQQWVFVVGLLVAIVMGLYPPWQFAELRSAGTRTVPAGYSFLAKPPQVFITGPQSVVSRALGYDPPLVVDERKMPQIDFQRLGLQWVLVSLVAAAMGIATRRTE